MEDFKRNAGTDEAVNDQATLSSTKEAVALKRRKLVSDEDGVESVFRSPEALHSPEEIRELGITSLGKNFPEKSSFLCLDRSPETTEVSATSCCSSNDSGETGKDALRQTNSNSEFETVDSTSMNNNKARKFSTGTKPPSEACADFSETKSPETATLPPRDEIEEFFAAAEKSEQKRFSQKYNFDIVKDLPLDGRYKWVCLKP